MLLLFATTMWHFLMFSSPIHGFLRGVSYTYVDDGHLLTVAVQQLVCVFPYPVILCFFCFCFSFQFFKEMLQNLIPVAMVTVFKHV